MGHMDSDSKTGEVSATVDDVSQVASGRILRLACDEMDEVMPLAVSRDPYFDYESYNS